MLSVALVRQIVQISSNIYINDITKGFRSVSCVFDEIGIQTSYFSNWVNLKMGMKLCYQNLPR